MAPYDSPPRSPNRYGSYNGSPRRRLSGRSAYDDPGLVVLEGGSSRDKFPRPTGGVAVREVYAAEARKDASSPERSPSRSSPGGTNSVVDSGSEKNAGRRFLWTTMDSVLVRPYGVATSWPIPLAAVCTPFSDGTDSTTMPVSDPKANGLGEPLRCTRCKCYANPHFRFSQREAVRLACNLCGHLVEATESLLQNVDDEDCHPELFYGSVDVVAPQHFDVGRPTGPVAPATLFVIEASSQAIASGLFHASLAALEHAVCNEDAPLRRRVSLVLFDEAVHFVVPTCNWNLRVVVMSTVEDPFLPVGTEETFFNTADAEDRQLFTKLLQELREQWSPPPESEVPAGVAAGAAVQCAIEAMSASGGGDVVVFHASSPSSGVGALKARCPDEVAVPQAAPFYEAMLSSCIKGGVAVSAITAPAPTVQLDVATLQWLAWRSGGDAFHLPDFNPHSATHTSQLLGTVHHWALSMMRSAYGCVFKLRTSRGLHCKSLIAPWSAAASSLDSSAFEISRLSPDSTVTCMLQADVEGDEDTSPYRDSDRRRYHYVQTVVLYSNARGERLLRVHTVPVGMASTARFTYQTVSIAPLMALLMKTAADLALRPKRNGKQQQAPKDYLLSILLNVVVHCAKLLNTQELAGRGFALAKKVALLPLYVLSARKLLIHIKEVQGETDRGMLQGILRMPIHTLMALLYPRAYVLVPKQDDCQQTGGLTLPMPELPNPCIPWQDILSAENAPILLFANGTDVMVHETQAAENLEEATAYKMQQRTTACYKRLVESLDPSQAWTPLRVLPKISSLPTAPASEKALLATLFVEDEGFNEMSYKDWISYVEAEVRRYMPP